MLFRRSIFVILSFLVLSFTLPQVSYAADAVIAASPEPDPVTSIVGAALGTPVSMIAGLSRGALSKSLEYTDSFPEAMGSGVLSNIVGIPTGAMVGLFTGAITGLLKGTFNGVINGIDYPFTAKSISLDGKFLDYEPYKILPETLY